MLLLIKYYVELSQYGDANYLIDNGLRLTQSLGLFIQMIEILSEKVKISEISQHYATFNLITKLVLKKNLMNDRKSFALQLLLKKLRILKLIKLTNLSESFKEIKTFICIFTNQEQKINFFDDIFIEIFLNICDALLPIQNIENYFQIQKDEIIKCLMEYLKQLLINSKSIVILYEKWYLAKYYFLLYELDSKKDLKTLLLAYNLIKENPHPQIYKRICLDLFDYMQKINVFVDGLDDGADKNQCAKLEYSDILPILCSKSKHLQRVSYLLEAQFIALRHKACSIQIKKTRKSNDQANDNLLNILSFDKNSSIYSFYESSIQSQIPEDWTIISLLIKDNQLYLVRLERNFEPFLFKLALNPQYLVRFQKIINDITNNSCNYDKSESEEEYKKKFEIFKSINYTINQRLIEYLIDIDENLFDFMRYILLGSYADKEVRGKCNEEIRKFYENFSMEKSYLTTEQKQMVYSIFNFIFDDKILNENRTETKIRKHLKSAFEYAGFNDNDRFIIYIVQKYIENESFRMKDVNRKHLCYLIDPTLNQIPWESLPLIESQPITRMLSFRFLIVLLKIPSENINKNEISYIIDPSNDFCCRSELIRELVTKNRWTGIVHRHPTKKEFELSLTEHSLFM